jgi:hypothetical protein
MISTIDLFLFRNQDIIHGHISSILVLDASKKIMMIPQTA